MRIAVFQPPEGVDWEIVDPDPNLAVYLNGKRQMAVVAADDEAGELWRAKRDENGNYIHQGEEFVYERLTGDVRFLKPQEGKGSPDRFPETLP
jgi:hypothetical protein